MNCSWTTGQAFFRGLKPISNFLYGCKNSCPSRDSNHTPPDHSPEALPTRLSVPDCCYAAIVFNLATSFTSEWKQYRSTKIKERKSEKITWEIKECFRRKAQKRSIQNICIKKTNMFTIIAMNLVEEQIIRSNISGRLPENSRHWIQ